MYNPNIQDTHNNAGDIPNKIPKQAREISAFFSLVIDETMEQLSSDFTSTGIRCFGKNCFGTISSKIDLDQNEIHWQCSDCNKSGIITGL